MSEECPSCGTPRHGDRYEDQWIDGDEGDVCPTCGEETIFGADPPRIGIHELDDDPDTVYVLAVPPEMPAEVVGTIAEAFDDNLVYAQSVVFAGDVDSDLAVGELSEEEMERIAEEYGPSAA